MNYVSGLAKTRVKIKFRDVLKSADTIASTATYPEFQHDFFAASTYITATAISSSTVGTGGGGGAGGRVLERVPSLILAEIKGKPSPDWTGI